MPILGRQYTRLIAIGLAVVLGAAVMQRARADHLLPARVLDCSANFPCPEAIKPRVNFWIEVFRQWDKRTAILHDPNRPERVYAVFNSGKGCHRAVRAKIERERGKIKLALLSVAAKRQAKHEITSANERHLAALFAHATPPEIRAAANNIRCQSGVRDSFINGLARYNHYRPMIDQVLAENNLPAEIRYLPFVESSYNPAAYSKAGAAGMWQIMPKTARVLGLELNATLDERLDPEAATRAAAKYLRRAGQALTATAQETHPAIARAQINPFIITSYNYGVYGMKRAMRQVEPDFMAVLQRHKSPRFQTAVKNFYASFLAASHVASNAERYFGELAHAGGDITTTQQTVVLRRPASMGRIEAIFGLDRTRLRPLNRALTRSVWRGQRLIPAGYRLRLPYRADHWQAERAKLAAMGPEAMLASGERYVVRRGDTACGIAARFGVDCRSLIRHNQLGRTALIYAGQKLSIPSTARGGVQAAGKRAAELSKTGEYIVRKNDSVCLVAQRFAVGCAALLRLNQLGRQAMIHPGQKLKIPGLATLASSAAASPDASQLKGADSTAPLAGKAVGDAPRGGEQAGADESARVASGNAWRELLDTLPNLDIKVREVAGQLVYTVRVEADETLGHFADWLGIAGTRALRDLNQLRSASIALGRRLRLPVADATMAARFEQRRSEYHQVLNEELKEHYDLAGVKSYTVRRGDSPWRLAAELGFPIWLLYRLNPILRDAGLQSGQTLLLPKLTEKS